MPLGEGNFAIDFDDNDSTPMITMNTRGSGEQYCHPLVLIGSPTDHFDAGWMSWIYH